MKSKVIVIGDGWSALGTVGFLVSSGRNVTWIAGTGARIVTPVTSLECRSELKGVEAWKALAEAFGISCGEIQTGSFLREFRNKAFREPVWTKAPDTEARLSTQEEVLFGAERTIAPIYDARFSLTLNEIEGQIRAALSAHPNLERLEGIPVTGFQIDDGKVQAVILGSGETIEAEEVYYADRWAGIGALSGLPKALPFLRKREPMGILQATFNHEVPMGLGTQESFYGALHREPGEESDRHVWGYFSSNGLRSDWSICLSEEEGQDNHAIAKRLRRMKSALDKMFTGEAWLPASKPEFVNNVIGEQVRFEESMLFAHGEPLTEPARIPSIGNLAFLTDGYGPSYAFHQVAAALGLSAPRPNAEAENVDQSAPISPEQA